MGRKKEYDSSIQIDRATPIGSKMGSGSGKPLQIDDGEKNRSRTSVMTEESGHQPGKEEASSVPKRKVDAAVTID